MPLVKDQCADDETEILEIEAVSIDTFLTDEHFDFIFMDIEDQNTDNKSGCLWLSLVAECWSLVSSII